MVKRILRFAMIGGSLGMLTACGLTGHSGDPTAVFGGSPTKSSGIRREAQGSMVFYTGLPGNMVKSNTNSLKWDALRVTVVQSNTMLKSPDPLYQGIDPAYYGMFIANRPAKSKLLFDSTDTNGDGWISGGFSAPCGITSGNAWYYPAAQPLSTIFVDTPTCPNGADVDYSTSQGDTLSIGAMVTESDPAGTNSALAGKIPLSTMQELINSIDSSDVQVTNVGGITHQSVRLSVTKVRVGGASYTPVGVYAELVDMKPLLAVRKGNPGAKLLMAWMANQLEKALDRGISNPQWSVTLNGAVTITSDQIRQWEKGSLAHTSTAPSRAWVDTLRARATTNVRGE